MRIVRPIPSAFENRNYNIPAADARSAGIARFLKTSEKRLPAIPAFKTALPPSSGPGRFEQARPVRGPFAQFLVEETPFHPSSLAARTGKGQRAPCALPPGEASQPSLSAALQPGSDPGAGR